MNTKAVSDKSLSFSATDLRRVRRWEGVPLSRGVPDRECERDLRVRGATEGERGGGTAT